MITKDNKLVAINKGYVCFKMRTSEYVLWLEKLLWEKLSQVLRVWGKFEEGYMAEQRM